MICRNADAFSGTLRSGTEAASRVAERSLDQFSKMFGIGGDSARQAVQQTADNIRALVEGTTIVAGALQDVSGEWMRFTQSRAEKNLEHFDQLIGCRSVHESLALQTQIVRDNFEALMQSARKSSERSTHAADEAVRKISHSSLAPH
jgi:hypothetical protein